jgi:hypothetical protein
MIRCGIFMADLLENKAYRKIHTAEKTKQSFNKPEHQSRVEGTTQKSIHAMVFGFNFSCNNR